MDHCRLLLLDILGLLLVVVARLAILSLLLPSVVLVEDVHHLFDEMHQRGYPYQFREKVTVSKQIRQLKTPWG